MKFNELNPHPVNNGGLRFTCPKCHQHKILINSQWNISGDYYSITISPSIVVTYQLDKDTKCKIHISVINGEVIIHPT